MSRFFPYFGGKHHVIPDLLKRMPEHNIYVEGFLWSGNLFFRKPKSRCEVVNDLNDDLVALFRCAQRHPEELLRQCTLLLNSRRVYEDLRDSNTLGLTDIERAARFLYLQTLAHDLLCGR